jgi:hypothetical protein
MREPIGAKVSRGASAKNDPATRGLTADIFFGKYLSIFPRSETTDSLPPSYEYD